MKCYFQVPVFCHTFEKKFKFKKMRKKLLLFFIAFGICTFSSAQNQTTPSTDLNNQVKPKKTIMIATISYGAAFRVSQSATDPDPNFNAVVSDLKSGSSFEANVYFLLKNRTSAIGLKYNQFTSSASSATYQINDKITFIGPAYLITADEGRETGEFSLDLAIGYMGLREEIENSPVGKFKLSGSSFGLSLGANYHFRITKNILVGPQINLLAGSIKEFELEKANGKIESFKLENNTSEGLTRIDLCISAKFRL